MTLNEYANAAGCPAVAFVVGVGYPTGIHVRLGDPDDDRAERWGLLGLAGEVGPGGGGGDTWEWDGRGTPRDDYRNSITRVTAWQDGPLWDRLGDE